MPRYITKLAFILLASSLLFIKPAAAVKIVRLELKYGSTDYIAADGVNIPTTNKVLDLELYDGIDQAPNTVANYLNYVTSGRYDFTFFNRSIPGSILQAGGVAYPYQSADPDNEPINANNLLTVDEFPPVANEPGISNIRGTIAMAKVAAQFVEGDPCVVAGPGCTLVDGTGPNSANSEWFLNSNDNSNPLDSSNGGFTVFGSVIDDGMETADRIALFPIVNLFFLNFITGASFDELPVADDTATSASSGLYERNLIMISSVTEINRPILRFAPVIANFGFAVPGADPKIIDVVLRNTGDEGLTITTITANDIAAPFSIQSENCSGMTLDPLADPFTATPVSSCTLTLKFEPTTTGVFSSDLVINYTSTSTVMPLVDGGTHSVKYLVQGEGALGVPQIVVVDKLDITSQVSGYSSSKDILISNTGKASLQIAALTDLNLTGFSQFSDCIGNNALIATGQTCTITVTFTANDFSEKVVTLSIESNDPVNNTIDIILTGTGDSDADGILSSIEDVAPNAGDNNFDGILDSKQNNIASLDTTLGDYISLVVDKNYVVSNVSVTPANQLPDLPFDVEFKYGDIGFQIDAVQSGAKIEVGLILPAAAASTKLTGYYFFGETADNATPHWYPYETVQIIVNGKLGGSQSAQDFIKLLVQDGGPGDADQVVNGRILLARSAPAYSSINASDDSSSSMNVVFLGFFVVLMLVVKRRRVAD